MTDVAGAGAEALDPTVVITESGLPPDETPQPDPVMTAYVLERAEAAVAGAKAKRDKYAALVAACDADVAAAEAALAALQEGSA